MIYSRKLLNIISEGYIDSEEIIIVTGMRRVGKTTLYTSLFNQIKSNNKVFIDMENPIDQKLFEESDYTNVITNLKNKYGINPIEKMYIFLDEIQAVPEIAKTIKYLNDHFPIKFLLTGSSSFYLKNIFPESLAGRKKIFELYPLDFEEFLDFKKEKKPFADSIEEKEIKKNKIVYEQYKNLYQEYLEFGGFPGVVTAENIDQKKERLEDIFKSYFEKEIKTLAGFREVSSIRDLMLLLMQRVGSKLEIGKLASEVGVSRETVGNYLNFLESTYFVHFISPYTTNVDREISSTKKVYLCDTGIINHFAKISKGSVFENAVFLAFKKTGNKICYYQKRHSETEIDFILPDSAVSFEIKIRGTFQDMGSLKRASLGIGISKYYIITQEYNDLPGFIPAIEF